MGVQSHCSKRRVSRAYSLTQLNRQKHRGVSCVNGDIDSYQLSLNMSQAIHGASSLHRRDNVLVRSSQSMPKMSVRVRTQHRIISEYCCKLSVSYVLCPYSSTLVL